MYQKSKLEAMLITLIFFLAVMSYPNAMFAQSDYQDVVYLKNGSIIRGMIIEQVPNQSLKIQTADGSVFVYEMDEVEKITKEEAIEQKGKSKSTSPTKKGTNSGKIIIVPYFSVGLTAAVPTLEELEYYYTEDYDRKVSPLSVGGGVQMLFAVKKVWLGFDIGARKTFKSTATYEMNLIYSTAYSEQIDKESALNILFLTEFRPVSFLFLQGGLGTYMSSWFYSYEYNNPDYPSSYDYTEYNGSHWNFGIMLAGGAEFPITKHISIPVYLRLDIMLRYGVMIPITANTGVRVTL